MKKHYAGFTLIEMLVVIATIVFLFGLFGVVAYKMKQRAQISSTKALIKRIQIALDAYYMTNRAYPPTGFTTLPHPFPTLPPYGSVDFDVTMITNWGSTVVFNPSEYDPKTPPNPMASNPTNLYLVDAWGHRIQYRKVSADRILIWSLGPPNKQNQYVNNIGNSSSLIDTDPAGLNISNTAADF